MSFSKYDIHLTHEDKSYNLILYDSNPGSKPIEGNNKININGRNYEIDFSHNLPQTIKEVFNNLRGKTFQTDQEFLKELIGSPVKINNLTITRRVYDLGK